MLHRRYMFVAAFFVTFFGVISAVAVELPDYLTSVTSQIERCIATTDNKSSIQYISYERLRQNWEIRWWSLLGYRKIPNEDLIRKTPELWNAGAVVKLSLGQYCDDVCGVRLLLHGGVSKEQLKERKEFSNIQTVELSAGKVKVGTSGDNGRAVVSVFEKVAGKWMLTDVEIQIK